MLVFHAREGTTVIRCVLVRGAAASPRSAVVALVCMPGLMVGEVVKELGSLIAMHGDEPPLLQ